ncbi:acyl-CoA dehydrogenase family protein [Amycolatopsis vancoresmycina]|uniref:Acyl-CoA dehydrogenase, N-terminal domain protein n=1 Tax=Amycolatopsis vancoresmycina DSM 44592 TaxID=1292037 RepID=R1FVX0_9PSEU|nr:acyl-CoA dehydrogenase family protein [Amycolatopsis vancoresmycina]EOD63533.1 acyl-CoA dehydrogenase, N-terminal domain protein [Amycolatopsis vancoresmycina DSM 44592]
MQQWTDKQQALRNGYTEVFRAWGADHLRRDREAEFAGALWPEIGASGLFGLPFGTEHGGGGHDLPTTMHVLEGLGYHCRDGGLNFSVSTQLVSTGVPIQRFGSQEVKDRFLPRVIDGSVIGAHAITEPDGGSDAAAMQTTAEPRGEDYVLNGRKCFITNGPVADVVLVYARTSPGTGPLGISVFAVERGTPGFEAGPPVDKMGLRTSPLGTLTFTDCVVPAANMVGRRGKGFLLLDYVMKWEVLLSFAISLGAMEFRLEQSVDYAKTRKQFGAPIASCQLIAAKIVEMKIDLETTRTWFYDTARRFEAGEDVMVDVAMAKVLASEANVRSATNAVQIFGGRGYLSEFGIEKELRDATGGTIYSGTSEVQRDKVARMLGVR